MNASEFDMRYSADFTNENRKFRSMEHTWNVVSQRFFVDNGLTPAFMAEENLPSLVEKLGLTFKVEDFSLCVGYPSMSDSSESEPGDASAESKTDIISTEASRDSPASKPEVTTIDKQSTDQQRELGVIQAEFLRELEEIKFILAFAKKYSNVLLLHQAIYGDAIPELKTREAYTGALLSKIGEDTDNFYGHGKGFLKFCKKLLSKQVMPKFDALLNKSTALEARVRGVYEGKRRAHGGERNPSVEIARQYDSEPPSHSALGSVREWHSRAGDAITPDAEEGDFYLTHYPFFLRN